MKFLQRPRQDLPKPSSKCRLREKQREDKEVEELSAFFSNKKQTGKKPDPGKTGADLITQRGQPSDNSSFCYDTIDNHQHTWTSSPRRSRDSFVLPGPRLGYRLSSGEQLEDPRLNPQTKISKSPMFCNSFGGGQLALGRDPSIASSPTPEPVREALAETGVYRLFEDRYRQRSRNQREDRFHNQDKRNRDIATQDDADVDICSIQPPQKYEIRYHDRGVMTGEDCEHVENLDEHPSVGDHSPQNHDSLETVGDSENKSKAPKTKVAPEEKENGSRVGDENGDKEDEAPANTMQIAQQAYIKCKEPGPENLEHPPRPKPPKASIVEVLESHAELVTGPALDPPCSQINMRRQGPQYGIQDFAIPSYGSNYDLEVISKPGHSCLDTSGLDMSYLSGHNLRSQIENNPTPVGTDLRPLHQHVTLQSFGVPNRCSSQLSQLANTRVSCTGFESTNITPEVVDHETVRNFIGRIEQEVREKADDYGRVPPSVIAPDKQCMLEHATQKDGLHHFNASYLDNPEIAIAPPRHGKDSQRSGRAYVAPIIEPLSSDGQSGIMAEIAGQVTDDTMARFWRPNQYWI